MNNKVSVLFLVVAFAGAVSHAFADSKNGTIEYNCPSRAEVKITSAISSAASDWSASPAIVYTEEDNLLKVTLNARTNMVECQYDVIPTAAGSARNLKIMKSVGGVDHHSRPNCRFMGQSVHQSDGSEVCPAPGGHAMACRLTCFNN
jgi:hypothetical protein